MPLDILLAVPNPLTVHISDFAPLADWPGIQGLPEYDEGNYLTVLFLAWAYILSARWAESLHYASDHYCTSIYKKKTCPPLSSRLHQVEIDIGTDIDTAEASWWEAILPPDKGWEIATDYNHKTYLYLSPWSVSLSDTVYIRTTRSHSFATDTGPPSSNMALQYLARFCSRYRLHGQCSIALAATLYIPFLNGRSVSLPLPKQALPSQLSTPFQSAHFSDLVLEYGTTLTRYMMLSCNIWDMRSSLCSTFFNVEVECNLVNAWLNPAFAIIDPLIEDENLIMIAKVLGK